MRVERHFAFVDLAGFTAFTDEHGDENAVEVLTRFRNEVRAVGTDHAVRVAKWLGDGCMLVSTEATKLVTAVADLVRRCNDVPLDLPLHVGMAGGDVILLEGDDYTGRAVNLAARLSAAAGPHEVLLDAGLAEHLPPGAVRPARAVEIRGFAAPLEVCELDPAMSSSTPVPGLSTR